MLILQRSNAEAPSGALYYCVVLTGFILSILGNVVEIVRQAIPFIVY
jgi:hypothetical protein